ncbi:FtsX-like permease family protein [Piscinibacterium candidicorallinum]|uniref:FtsX-like permease family protein n=1 Tax=Piscinibacterium candidicorallinum TaxID=1793872 RepID=A0ABV7H878_9BURK
MAGAWLPPKQLSRWLLLGLLRSRRTATALSVLAIALGVALGYAIHLINSAALSDFSRAMQALQGEPDAILSAADGADGRGVDLAQLNTLARDPQVLIASPVIQLRVQLIDDSGKAQPITLLGLDTLSIAQITPTLLPRDQRGRAEATNLFGPALFASPTLVRELGGARGQILSLRRGTREWQAPLAGDLPALGGSSKVLVADIAWVQAALGEAGQVSEIRLRLAPDVNADTWIAQTRAQLDAALLIKRPEDDNLRVSNLSRAYRVNLNVLALVALLTGAFLVFATQLTAVAQRAPQFALLGVLGLTPRQRFMQILLEGSAIGVPGALLGLMLGYGLALLFTWALGGDLGGGYFAGSNPVIDPAPWAASAFALLGLIASVAGAWYPALLNRAQTPAQTLKSGFVHERHAATPRRRAALLLVLAALIALLLTLPPWRGLPVAGYAAIALVLVLGILLAPIATAAAFRWLARRPRSGRGAPLTVAAQQVAQAPLMAQVAASGLIVSFALTASMVIMVSSFREAVDTWLDEVLPAPLYARTRGTPLPAPALDALAASGRFERIEKLAVRPVVLDPARPALDLVIRDLDPQRPGERLPFTGAVLPAPPGSVSAWISEPMSVLYDLQPGDRLRLPLLGSTREFHVGGVWRDYARQFGAVTLARSDFEALGGRFEASDIALWPREGQLAPAKALLSELTARHGVEVAESAEIRALSLRIFDRSFAVTYALEAAAMLIGLFGLAVTLAASVWMRSREMAMLAALGFSRAMLTQAVRFEGVLIVLTGLAVGTVCGVAIGAILTHVINPQAFHWRMPLDVPWRLVAAGALATLVAGLVASHLAARRATRLPVAQILASSQ